MDDKAHRERLTHDLEQALADERKEDRQATDGTAKPSSMAFLWASIGAIALLGIALRLPSADPPSIEAQAAQLVAQAAASPRAVLAREATEFYQGYLDQSKTCDAFNPRVSAALNANDVVEVYSAASEGAKACGAAARAVGMLRIPDTDYDRSKEREFDDARETCRLGLKVQQEALEALADMANGDMRAETQAKMRKARQEVDTLTMGCAAKMVQAVKTSGGKLPPSVDPNASS